MEQANRLGPAARGPRRRLALARVVVGVAGVVALTLLLGVAAKGVPADSDGASLVLEGQSVAHGHVLLQGWALSLDSFWTSEVPFYAVGVLVAGVAPGLLTGVPAVLYAVTVVLALAAATVGLSRRAAGLSALVTFVLVAFPTWALTMFVLRGGHHLGAVICSLAAFLVLARRQDAPAVSAATIFLVVGMLGDLQTVAYATVPVICVGVVRMVRHRRLAAGRTLVGCGAGSAALFVVLREIARAAGAFSSGKANALAHTPAQIEANVGHLYSLGGELVGLKSSVFGSDATPAWLQDAHVVGAVVVGVCAVAAFARLVAGTARGTEGTPDLDVMDGFLVFAALGSAASYLLLAYVNSTSFARYLAPTAIYLFVLTARTVGRLVRARGRDAVRRGAVVATVLLGALFAAGFAYRTTLPQPVQPGTDLARWLVAHDLHSGVGAYWAASITTVVSHGAVRVRPVVPDPAGRLVRYDRESDADWYAGQRFSFLVFPSGAAAAGVDAPEATKTWGPPSRSFSVDGYHVLVWDHPFGVPATGGFGS